MNVMADTTHIRNSPVEILETIFDQLPFRVRQNAKLVCRRWCEVLLMKKYRKQEKIVVRALYPIEEIFDVLSSGGVLINLEFQNVHLDKKKFDSSSFWIARGAQIEELRFSDCVVDPETFSCMAVQCENLQCLYWHNGYEHQGTSSLCSSETLDFLMDKNFSHKSLIVFETDLVSLYWLSKFQKVFPNVERISYVLVSYTGTEGNAKESRKVRLVNDRKLPVPKMSRKKLTLRFGNLSATFLSKTLVSVYELRRFREIEVDTHLSIEKFPRDEFLHVVRQQPLLEKFKFVADNFAWSEIFCFGENLLETLFERSKNLRWLFLNLGDTYELVINAALYLKIKASQINYLRLQCSGLIRFENVSYDDNIQKNSTLEHLCVYSRLSVDDIGLLLRSFSRLKHLEMNWLRSNDVLNLIITHQCQLESLRLVARDEEKLPELGGNSGYQFYHVEKLRNLKYLLMYFDEGARAQKDRLMEFQLPNLEYLYVKSELGDLEVFEAWLNTLSKSPKLRALHVYNAQVKIPFKLWLKLCSSLKNLEYLCIQGCPFDEDHVPFTEEEFLKLFDASPALRVVSQIPTDSYWSYISAMYDRVRREIFISKFPTYFITNLNLNKYNINWLEF